MSTPELVTAPAVPDSALAALLGKRVTVYLWIRTGFLHFAADLTTTGRGNYHLIVIDSRSPHDGPQAGVVFAAADVEAIGAFPDGRPRITLKAEARK